MTEGCVEYLQSYEHKGVLPTTRLEGARDFLKSSAFQVAMEIKAAQFTNDGFKLCRAQTQKLGCFVKSFHQSRLDPTLNCNLEAPSVYDAPTVEPDEFDALMNEIEWTFAPSL
ncbi:hypothetical protein Salat_1183700 [Sesamum alatum]|uniref:Uncharacterized protein n=1 Tax=Sesamum alatum TaxID=300844 RepID=A0AAE2CNL9_9LAMI|nr:hypothetical protein Salat_1183700 [Sesamum alatum]